jgi:peptidoglycan/LPS O-acetylase OafA/YrhL
LGATAAAASAFVPNLALWRQAGYFDAEAASKPLLHLWSLGVEEQFYLVWPLFLVLGRRSRWPFVPVVGSALALSFVSGAVLLARDPSAGFYWPQARAWELLVGALLAGSTGDVPGSSFTLTRHGLSAAGLVVVVGSMLLLRKRSTKAVLTAS